MVLSVLRKGTILTGREKYLARPQVRWRFKGKEAYCYTTLATTHPIGILLATTQDGQQREVVQCLAV